jgi:hemerythrin-like domain-containing protein
MKGLIISELIDFIERHCALNVAEQIIDEAGLESQGAVTSVGNYPHQEAIKLVTSAARTLDQPAEDIMRQFGRELFDKLQESHSQFFEEGADDAFTFLSKIQSHIHAEVKKLYPGANPPRVSCSIQDDQMKVVYESHRPFAMVAFGLLEGCCAHFDDALSVQIDTDPKQDPAKAAFTVSRSNTH